MLKVGVSLAILGFLVREAWRNQVFEDLMRESKDWRFLLVAVVSCSTAVSLTIVRWGYLVRALGIPFPTRDAFRLGMLGYLFNLAPMGIVGGDLLKAVMLAWEHKGNHAKAVASVVVDRLIGLYLLFVFASGAILLTGAQRLPVEMLADVCQWTLILTVVGAMGFGLMFSPWLTEGRFARYLGRLPKIGPYIEQTSEALRMYRQKPFTLFSAAAMSLAVHGLFATGVYCISRGLLREHQPLSVHYVIMPLAAVTGVLPLPLGPFEWVLDQCYKSIPLASGRLIVAGKGLLVALCYRCITLLIAGVGIGYYLTSRREMAEVMQEAEHSSQS